MGFNSLLQYYTHGHHHLRSCRHHFHLELLWTASQLIFWFLAWQTSSTYHSYLWKTVVCPVTFFLKLLSWLPQKTFSVTKTVTHIIIKFCLLMYMTWLFLEYSELFNYHYYLLSGHFHHPQMTPHPLASVFPFFFPTPQALINFLYFFLIGCTILDT